MDRAIRQEWYTRYCNYFKNYLNDTHHINVCIYQNPMYIHHVRHLIYEFGTFNQFTYEGLKNILANPLLTSNDLEYIVRHNINSTNKKIQYFNNILLCHPAMTRNVLQTNPYFTEFHKLVQRWIQDASTIYMYLLKNPSWSLDDLKEYQITIDRMYAVAIHPEFTGELLYEFLERKGFVQQETMKLNNPSDKVVVMDYFHYYSNNPNFTRNDFIRYYKPFLEENPIIVLSDVSSILNRILENRYIPLDFIQELLEYVSPTIYNIRAMTMVQFTHNSQIGLNTVQKAFDMFKQYDISSPNIPMKSLLLRNPNCTWDTVELYGSNYKDEPYSFTYSNINFNSCISKHSMPLFYDQTYSEYKRIQIQSNIEFVWN